MCWFLGRKIGAIRYRTWPLVINVLGHGLALCFEFSSVANAYRAINVSMVGLYPSYSHLCGSLPYDSDWLASAIEWRTVCLRGQGFRGES
jgi:hypothetical protein